MASPRRHPALLFVLLPAWGLGIATGIGLLDLRVAEPGPASAAPETIDRRGETLVFIHPHCPCSRATLAELARALRDKPAGVVVRVLMYEPTTPPPGWTRGPLWDDALALPGVTVEPDFDGRRAAQFGAETSGWVVAYDTSGRLTFSGGITGGRGHEGDNPGRDALSAAWNGRVDPAGPTGTPVFGCRLFDPDARPGSFEPTIGR